MIMSDVFPTPITSLPQADIPLKGVKAHLLQGEGQQLVFMEYSDDAELPAHSHEAQWGVVLEGRIDLVIGGNEYTFVKGDRYYISEGVEHSGKIYAGYADITFFDVKDRYSPKVRGQSA
jgi:quercetin dioxygenase-like cupin family protein